MIARAKFLVCTALTGGCLWAMAVPGVAADLFETAPSKNSLPAVSDINGKIAAGFGSLDDDALAFGAGSLTIPVGQSFGFQVDTLGGTVGGDGAFGVAGHGFWRDPATGLVGLYGSYLHYEGTSRDVAHVGVEGEAYFGRLALEGIAGFEFGNGDGSAFGSAGVAFYPVDDLRLYAAYRYTDETSIGAFGAEWQPRMAAMPGLALFADGRVGDNDNWAAYGGLRFYFGADKSLIQRHREDDPVNNLLPDDLFGVSSDDVCPAPKVIIDGHCVPVT